MSIVRTVSCRGPENACVRRTWRQRTSARRLRRARCGGRAAWPRAASARVRVRRTARRQSRRSCARRVRGVDLRHLEAARLRPHDDPRGRAGQPGAEVGALDVERAEHPHVRGVGRRRPRASGSCRASATAGRRRPPARRTRPPGEAGRRDQERAVAAHEQLLRVAGHVDRAELARAVAARVERPQLALARHVERGAGGLHPVRLVDARLLHVGRRGALAARGGRRRRNGRGRAGAVLGAAAPHPAAALGDRRRAERERRVADHPQAVALGVAEQVRARGEGVQPRALLARLGVGRRRARRPAVRRPAGARGGGACADTNPAPTSMASGRFPAGDRG